MSQYREPHSGQPGRPVTLPARSRPAFDGGARRFHPPGWSRAATSEDVETARRVMPMHAPADAHRGICASALHLVNAPAWPCEQYQWARAVLDAADRREIP